jgi:hypothetical protein
VYGPDRGAGDDFEDRLEVGGQAPFGAGRGPVEDEGAGLPRFGGFLWRATPVFCQKIVEILRVVEGDEAVLRWIEFLRRARWGGRGGEGRYV